MARGRSKNEEARVSDTRDVDLAATAQRKYLSYALSVITSRALPDVRDGLKPVQRRILYAMYSALKLTPDARYRKSAAVVGEVMARLHPHGDQAIYDAMVRMAQPFSLLHPVVDGHGNFGSMDGDRAAAMRYTEARLRPFALELLGEIRQDTVDFRTNFDATTTEPVVLPSRVPNLLVNGTMGIAVGMASTIPPHNLREVVKACLRLLDKPDADTDELLSYIKGPDFPTGGELVTTRKELVAVYEKGRGGVVIRGTWEVEEGDGRRRTSVVINSVPFGTSRAAVVQKIADLLAERKLPMVTDVRDESSDVTRIVLELRRGAEPAAAMAYIMKATTLQQRYRVDLTCLVPTNNPEVAGPERLSLKEVLEQFLAFRQEVVTRRYRHELRELQRRIHILEGFRIVFDDLSRALNLIRRAKGRIPARKSLMKYLGLDTEQADAVLDTRLYRLSKLEISTILEELEGKEARAAEVKAILRSPKRILEVVRSELRAVVKAHSQDRKTRVVEPVEEPELDLDKFVRHEDSNVILTRDGWVKRVTAIKDLEAVRVREGDRIVQVLAGNTSESVVFITNVGLAYTQRIIDYPATTGYGTPVQGIFKFRDGERIVAAFSLDPRAVGDIGAGEGPHEGGGSREDLDPAGERETEGAVVGSEKGGFLPGFEIEEEGSGSKGGKVARGSAQWVPPVHAAAVTSQGMGFRISLAPFAVPSTKNGRRFARLGKDDELAGVQLVRSPEHTAVVASRNGRALLLPFARYKYMSTAGKGRRVIRLSEGDRVVVFDTCKKKSDVVRVLTARGRKVRIGPGLQGVSARAGAGAQIVRLSRIEGVVAEEPRVVDLGISGKDGGGRTGNGEGE